MTERTEVSGGLPGILLIEDSPVEAELLRRTLVRAGYAVSVAPNGEEGLQAARARRPALVMSDVRMPVMDGYQLCRAIKYDDELWNIPLILLSVLSGPEDIIEAINSGADAYILKPFDETNLLDRILALLDAPVERRRADERRDEVVGYGGKRYAIAGGGQQILNLLLSLYENILNQNRKMVDIQAQLNLLNDGLDRQVRESERAEESLRKLSQAVEQSPSSIVITDLNANIEYVNDAFVKVTGYSRAELVGKNPRILQSGKTAKATYGDMWAHLTRGEAWKGELINRRKDGSEYIESMLIAPVRQTDGSVANYLAIKEDVTQFRQAQEAARVSRENLYRLLNSMAEGAYGVDTDGNCTFVNRAFLQMLGYQSDAEVLGKHTHELMHHSHADGSPYPANECKAYRAYLTNQLVNVSDEVFWCKDGIAIPVEYWSHPIVTEGVVTGAIVTFIDITERKKAETALRDEKHLLSESQRIAHTGSWRLELTGQLTWSDETYRIYGVSPDTFVPNVESLLSLIHPDDRLAMQAWIGACVEGKKPGALEFRINKPDGTGRILSGYGELKHDDGNRPTHLSGIVHDITERKQAEAKLAEQMEELRRWHDVTSGREERILDLKHEVNELLAHAGQPPRYPSAESQSPMKE